MFQSASWIMHLLGFETAGCGSSSTWGRKVVLFRILINHYGINFNVLATNYHLCFTSPYSWLWSPGRWMSRISRKKFLWRVPSSTRVIPFLSKLDFFPPDPLILFSQKRNEHSFCWQSWWNAELHTKMFSPFEPTHRWIHLEQ